MSWSIELSRQAEKQFDNLPRDRQLMIGRAIEAMKEDPFRGDVRPLRGKKWKGRYRKRVGSFRLIYLPFLDFRRVEISAILSKSEATYR